MDTLGDIRDDTRAGFRTIYGKDPHGLWSAPGVMRLIGDHTEYADGHTLCCALDVRTVVALGVREDRTIRVASVDQDEIAEISLDDLDSEALEGWPQYPLGTAWAMGQFGADLQAMPGVDLYIDSDVPVGLRMGSSVALTVAVALALRDAWQVDADLGQLARICNLSESLAAGEDVGLGPILASLAGTADQGVLVDGRSKDFENVALGLEAHDHTVVLVHTHAEPRALPPLAERLQALEHIADALDVPSLREAQVADMTTLTGKKGLDAGELALATHAVRENARVLEVVRTLREEGPEAIGHIFAASHQSLADAFGSHTLDVDLAVSIALDHGASAARLLGHRTSGSVVALVPQDALSRISQALDTGFSEHGLATPDVVVVNPSDHATRH
ncbi:galactokinase family protein [Pontimonas sp.]|uniref:galactokinase n=1 Tax=Pontimonas sp. TaxID=2304492 RepID=UPI002870B029|nr:galactokinase family protein [Pontimonas sp.]MDR9397259.1 galactokinase family protein [Pontimonas sp.]